MTSSILDRRQTLRLAIGDDLAEVDRAVLQAEAFATKAGVDDDRRYALQVCVEEALANLVMHGRAGPGGKQIDLRLEADRDLVLLTISDACTPFDVTTAVIPPKADPLEPGGRGIALLRAFSKAMRYAREGDRNLLEIEI